MLRFLQKRKFRLVTRWRSALKENIGFQPPANPRFPYTLIFRTFDEIVLLLKWDQDKEAIPERASILADIADDARPTADQFMELFLTGRDVLGEFVETDEAFCRVHVSGERQMLRAALEHTFKRLIDREMLEHTHWHQKSEHRAAGSE